MTNGIVIGRFMPLQTGHIAMIRTAQALVDHLTIIVCWQKDDAISGAQRLQWLLECAVSSIFDHAILPEWLTLTLRPLMRSTTNGPLAGVAE